MSTAELIYEKAKALPESLQTEALHYVDYLTHRADGDEEATDWARFSAQNLARAYGSADNIYDKDYVDSRLSIHPVKEDQRLAASRLKVSQ